MKRYLTFLFIGFSVLSVIIGFRFDVRWNGVMSWGLALIFLLFAAYFTKYISDDTKQKNNVQLDKCEEKRT